MSRRMPNEQRYILLCFALLFAAQTFARAESNRAAADQFAQLEKSHHARIGVAAVDLARQRPLACRADERFAMCSTFKLLAAAAVLHQVDEGREQLDRFVPYTAAQLLEYAPVTRAHVKEGGMKLEALCAAAIELSDNTAGNLLLEAIGGPPGLTEFARSLGDPSTRLDRKEPELNNVIPGDPRDTTTPAAMCRDLQRLLTSDFLTAGSRARLEGWMQKNQTGADMIRAQVPADWKVGDKTGRSGKGAVNDVAILRPPTGGPICLAIYVYDPDEASEARGQLVAEAARIALQVLRDPAPPDKEK